MSQVQGHQPIFHFPAVKISCVIPIIASEKVESLFRGDEYSPFTIKQSQCSLQTVSFQHIIRRNPSKQPPQSLGLTWEWRWCRWCWKRWTPPDKVDRLRLRQTSIDRPRFRSRPVRGTCRRRSAPRLKSPEVAGLHLRWYPNKNNLPRHQTPCLDSPWPPYWPLK